MNDRPEAADLSALSPRQRQILDLLQAGKVNKEIANELGIGLGTVKQHVVALFKKLNVKNRAMAVSRGMERRPGADEAATLTADGLLERRPCVVLSLALPETAEATAVRRLHGSLASLAFDSEAVFLARKGNAGDIIFGAQRSSEHDLLKALDVARAVHAEMAVRDAGLAEQLRGGISAGLAVASMHRHGGWTGEAIASAAIATARESLQSVAPGQLAFSTEARDLMRAFGIGRGREIAEAVRFDALATLGWTGERTPHALVGREAERARLHAALRAAEAGAGQLLHLEGETGMGKSSLCSELAGAGRTSGLTVGFFRCLPDAEALRVYDCLGGGVEPYGDVLVRLRASRGAALWIMDDVQLLPKTERVGLERMAAAAAETGVLALLSGRRLDARGAGVLHLGRLPVEAMRRLTAEALPATAGDAANRVSEIVRCASGVPLFAVELARHMGTAPPPLSLLTIVAMRLDSLGLDRLLLRALARSAGALSLDDLTDALGEDAASLEPAVRQAVSSGVLNATGDGRYDFSHPLIRRVVAYLSMDAA